MLIGIFNNSIYGLNIAPGISAFKNRLDLKMRKVTILWIKREWLTKKAKMSN